jgi:hypothetical protein
MFGHGRKLAYESGRKGMKGLEDDVRRLEREEMTFIGIFTALVLAILAIGYVF